MKTIEKNYFFLLILISLFFVFACSDPFEFENQMPVENGYGRISITFTEGDVVERTAFPSLAFDSYVYTFTKEGGTAVVRTPVNNVFLLETGSYTVAVQAFIGSTLVASGVSLPFNVAPGNNGPVSVPLFAATIAGSAVNGTFTYTITYPAGADAVITLQGWPGRNEIALNPASVSEGNGKTQTLELAAGYYMLTILVSNDDFYAGKNEAVHIYPSLPTVYTKNFATADLLAAVPITNVEITVTAPIKSEMPDTTAHGAGNFTIDPVSWSPDDKPFQGNVSYTATVTLTANSRFTFTGLQSATLDGENMTASNNSGKAVTLSYTFSPTENRDVTSIAIKTPPAKLSYTHGDQLDLTGLVVTLFYDDSSTEDVDITGFTTKHITAEPSNGNHLVHVTHNGKPVTIKYGHLEKFTGNLTVSKAPGTFHPHLAIDETYTPTLTLADLNIQLGEGYAWTAPATSLNAGDGQSFAATYTDPSGNFETANGFVTVNVAKAAGANVSAPEGAALVTEKSVTIHPVDAPATGQTVLYAINTTDNSGNIPSSDWQESTTFSGLSPATDYWFFACAQENSNYNQGSVSGSLKITTLQPVSQNRFEYYWVNEHGSLVTTSGGATTVIAGDTLTITARDDGYDVKQWHLNGVNAGVSGNTYTFSRLSTGTHAVGLFVEKDGKLYNTNIIITVDRVVVTFNLNGGTGTLPAARTINAGSGTVLPDATGFTRNGYTFAGWNTSPDGTGTNYNAGDTYLPISNDTLFAKWIFNATVSFSPNGGGGMPPASQTAPAGSTITLPANSFSRYSYEFVCWNTAADGTGTNYNPGDSFIIPTENVVLYAKWIFMATVSFDINTPPGHSFSTSPDAQTARAGSTIMLPTVSFGSPILAGWNTAANGTGTDYEPGSSYTVPEANITLYARWIPGFLVTFNIRYATGTTPASQAVFDGASILLPDDSGFSRAGYIFGGWRVNGGGPIYNANEPYTPTIAGTSLWAYWIPVYTVSFSINSGSGTVPAAQVVPDGTVITLPDNSGFSRNGYTFSGWNTSADGNGTNYNAGSLYTVTGDVRLFAKWDAFITVNFDTNNGTGPVPSSQTVLIGSIITLPNGDGLSRPGYTFSGWNTKADGTGLNYHAGDLFIAATNSNTPPFTNDLYASWILPGKRIICVDMYDSYGDSWNGNGELIITVNGTNINAPGRNCVGSYNNFPYNNSGSGRSFMNKVSFMVETGDLVQVYWYTVFSGSDEKWLEYGYQHQNSFVMYYADLPPSPAFFSYSEIPVRISGLIDMDMQFGPTSWNGSNVLLYRLRSDSDSITGSDYLTNVLDGTLLGSFTVE